MNMLPHLPNICAQHCFFLHTPSTNYPHSSSQCRRPNRVDARTGEAAGAAFASCFGPTEMKTYAPKRWLERATVDDFPSGSSIGFADVGGRGAYWSAGGRDG